MKIDMVAAASLVLDHHLYPRHVIDDATVTDLVRALEADATEVEDALEVWAATRCGCAPPKDGTHASLAELSRCLLDAAEARVRELEEAGREMMAAANELMTEFVSKRRAANWCVINDAMVRMGKALARRTP